MKKYEKDWSVSFPWGKVAMVSWGDPINPPVLMVHGYMDSAATFIPLLELLPDDYYYVSFDIPGNGKSDAFPPGVILSQLHIVEVVRGVVEHMKWNSFVYMSHSMAFIIGMLFNYLYPGNISKMVHLDPGPGLSLYYFPHHNLEYWYLSYDYYYSHFDRWQSGNSKTMTHKEAIDMIVHNRSLTKEQAAIVVSRSLIPVDDGKFRFSWDMKMKKMVTAPLSEDTLFTIITEHAPPMLILESSQYKNIPGRPFSNNILERCCRILPHCTSVSVNGGHDIHIINPEIILPHIFDFLNEKICKKAKL